MSNKVFNELALEIIHTFITNNNTPLHGRAIARQLKKNQRTTQNTLDALTRAHLLTATLVGKAKQYTINLSSPTSPSFILMAEAHATLNILNNFEIAQIITDLRKLTTSPICIFGSHAKDYATKHSDLDILIITDKKINTAPLQALYTKKLHILTITKKGFEQGLKNKDAFPKEILTHHIICQDYEYFINLWRTNI